MPETYIKILLYTPHIQNETLYVLYIEYKYFFLPSITPEYTKLRTYKTEGGKSR
jgi:hypothetical protein